MNIIKREAYNYKGNMLIAKQMGFKTYNLKHNKNSKWKNTNEKKQNIMSEIVNDYMANSTIHGISYIGAKNKNWIEKTWWIIGFVLSVTTCTYFINNIWTKWTENPTIISFARDYTPIWDIPFPAVTICPQNKARINKFNFNDYFNRYFSFMGPKEMSNKFEIWRTPGIFQKFWDISFICHTYMHSEGADNVTTEIFSNIKMVAPTLNLTLGEVVEWQQERVAVEDYFAEYITSDGLCFTFNAFGHKDMYTEEMKGGVNLINYNRSSTGWSMEDGYSRTKSNKSLTDYPLRTSQSGLIYGLNIINLWTNLNEKTQHCSAQIGKFKMVLHNPAEIPRLTESHFLLSENQKVIVSVTPKVIKASKSLINIASKIRNCYFAQERKLRFFKVYTQYNCKTECFANVTLQHCGCAPFYLPRDNKTEICGYGRLDCLVRAEFLKIKYINLKEYTNITDDEPIENEIEVFKKCDCLPSCDYLDYQVELSQAEETNPTNDARGEKTQMTIFFKDSQFLAMERNELYGQTDFISNAGGLLGLFMGFSFLSLLEIIYFATLRLWCKIYHKYKSDIAPKSES